MEYIQSIRSDTHPFRLAHQFRYTGDIDELSFEQMTFLVEYIVNHPSEHFNPNSFVRFVTDLFPVILAIEESAPFGTESHLAEIEPEILAMKARIEEVEVGDGIIPFVVQNRNSIGFGNIKYTLPR